MSASGNVFFVRAVHNALLAEVREGLRAPMMKEAEALVDAAVDRAIEALRPRIEVWANEQYDRLDVRILLERTDGKKQDAPS